MPEADLILENGIVITLDRGSTVAEAVAIRHGRIVAVGPSAALSHHAGPQTQRIDLRGRTVIPGFMDAHPHVDRTGLKAGGGIPITGLHSIAEIIEVVHREARSTPPGEWIVLGPMGDPPYHHASHGEEFEDRRFPNRHDLDAAAPEHPVYIRAAWGGWAHLPCPSVANSRALAEAGIGPDTPAPHKVEMVRDSQGEPTGVFLERNYVPLLEYTLFRTLPAFSHEDRVDAIRRGVALYSAAGTTSAFEAHGITPAVISAYRQIRSRDSLPLRLHAPISVPSAVYDDGRLGEFLRHYARVAREPRLGDDWLRVDGITFGGRGDKRIMGLVAAGYPYERWAGHFYQSIGPGRFLRLGLLAASLGQRIHRMASRHLEHVLWGYETIDRELSIRDQRCVAVNVSAATPSQLRRLKELGVLVALAPGALAMAGGDSIAEDGSGEQPGLLRELLDAGVPVAQGTSGVWPSMLWTMWAALRGWDGRARTRRGDSLIGREEALRLAVQSGHRLTRSEDRRGSLEVGKDADLVVLGGNPLTCPEDGIKDLPVDLTIVGGHIAHDRLRAVAAPASAAPGPLCSDRPRPTTGRRHWWTRWASRHPEPGSIGLDNAGTNSQPPEGHFPVGSP